VIVAGNQLQIDLPQLLVRAFVFEPEVGQCDLSVHDRQTVFFCDLSLAFGLLGGGRAELPLRKERGRQVAKPQCIKLSIFQSSTATPPGTAFSASFPKSKTISLAAPLASVRDGLCGSQRWKISSG
jgi:hypothetical protein